MRLSDLKDIAPMDVVRDGEFASLGYLRHHMERMLVAFFDRAFLGEVEANADVACALTTADLAPDLPAGLGVAVCADPREAFFAVHGHLAQRTGFYWRDFPSEIAPGARIHERAYVAPRNVRIGPGTLVEPHAVILERSVLGADVVVRAGAVIGGEGYEPKTLGGRLCIVPHAGGVRLHDRVEIHANAHVARALFGGFTEVLEDTKVDALCHIGHNVRVGRRCRIATAAMVCGSTVLGDDVWVGPGAVLSSDLTIGDGASITIGAVVTRDVAARQRVTGHFALDHSRWIAFMRGIR